MKVIVNAVGARLGHGAVSLARYLKALSLELPEATFDVFVSDEYTLRDPIDRVTWCELTIPRGLHPKRLLWDNVGLPRRARSYDALLSPLNFGPVRCSVPHVLLQRNMLYFVDAPPDATARGRVERALYRALAGACMRGSDLVVVPTQAMTDAIAPVLRGRAPVSVAHHGLPPGPASAAADLPDGIEEWSSADVRLIHVGVPSPHKDLACVARTFAALRSLEPDRVVRLAVTFRREDGNRSVNEFVAAAADAGVLDLVSFLGPLSNERVLALYSRASATLFPSSCESFGFPILESFAAGTPVVASDLPALCEVAGGHARHHPVGDAATAARLVQECLRVPFPQGRAAMDEWLAHFTLDAEVRPVASALRELVGARRVGV